MLWDEPKIFFLERRYFFSIILSEFLKNRVALQYDSASTESKKMIVSCLIRRVEVYRDYRLHIDFNIDFEQFSAGLDISAIAA